MIMFGNEDLSTSMIVSSYELTDTAMALGSSKSFIQLLRELDYENPIQSAETKINKLQENITLGLEAKGGIALLLTYLKENTPIISSPKDEEERKEFYEILAKGFCHICDSLEKQLDSGKINQQNIHDTLDLIGKGGIACAGRWRTVISSLIDSLPPELQLSSPTPLQEKNGPNERFQTLINTLVFKAKNIEANKLALSFVEERFPKLRIGDKIHYELAFKKFLNQNNAYKLPILDDQDSFFAPEMEWFILKEATAFLRYSKIKEDSFKTFEELFQHEINKNSEFRDSFIESIPHILAPHLNSKDKANFLSEKVFKNDQSYDLKPNVLKDVLTHWAYLSKKEINYYLYFKLALHSKNLHEMNQILKKLPDEISTQVKILHSFGRSALLNAAAKGYTEIIKNYAKHGVNLNIRSFSGDSPLILSIQGGFPETARLLIENGAQVNFKGTNQNTALLYAVAQNKMGLAKLLIKKGADLNIRNKEGKTALLLATEHNYTKLAKLLIQNGADLHIKNAQGDTALLLATYNGNTELVKFFSENQANLNDKNNLGLSALSLATQKDDGELVQFFLDKGVDVNAKTVNNSTPLIFAASNNFTAIAKMLLDRNAEVNTQNTYQDTALLSATKNGNEELSKLLLDKGAHLESKDYEQSTPLILAVNYKHSKLAKVLIENNANINASNRYDETPLFSAARNNDTELANILLEKDARVNVCNRNWETPLLWAAHHSNTELAKMLINKGANINAQDKKGNTALILATKSGNTELIRYIQNINLLQKINQPKNCMAGCFEK